ncbi:MAG: ATP-binding protein [Actinomycetota bacterium]|nr:ATP-binding protein [Actinomycetota bacterium]
MSRGVQRLAAGAPGAATGLIEREDELARIDAALEAARAGTGATVLIEAAAGIGKTSLIALACERAASAGMTVLDARGSPLERDYAMGVVRQCFEPELHRQRDVDALFSGAAELARHVVFDAPARFDAAPEGVLHGLYWLTAILTERAPVLLAIDDAHWADEESLRFVAYMARRVQMLPVALLVGSRPPEDPTAAAVLDELRREPATSVLEPAPLDSPPTGCRATCSSSSPTSRASPCMHCSPC